MGVIEFAFNVVVVFEPINRLLLCLTHNGMDGIKSKVLKAFKLTQWQELSYFESSTCAMHAENNSNQQAMQNSSIVKIVASSCFADGSVLLSQTVCVCVVYMVKCVALPRYIRTLFLPLSGRYEWKLKSFKHIWWGTTIQTIALVNILFSCTNIGDLVTLKCVHCYATQNCCDFRIRRVLQKLYIEMVKFFV